MPCRQVMDRFIAFADRTPKGIDAFLFVVKWGRLKPEHEAAFDAFVANCGRGALAHTLLVFTHCALSDAELAAALAGDAPAWLQSYLPELRGFHAVDNVAGADRGAFHGSLDALIAANDGRRSALGIRNLYTTFIFQYICINMNTSTL